MERKKVQALIEMAKTPEEADQVISGVGFTTIYEKMAYLKGMFDFELIGRYNDAERAEEQVRMDYFSALSAIINAKWEA
ncbi:MAG: hypothetical protein NC121_15405 [Blautia sp.]|nr:hypothetical protein [Blautia sp.]